ncbi:Scarecrow-like protein 8, partial [Cucurbita argyrosperma subsp. sororia]
MMMNHRLQELEKELLEDKTTMMEKPVLTSPTTSTSSSCSSSTSSSVASTSSDTWKQSVIEAAAAISEGKLEVMDEILAWVVKISNARGSSVQRFAEYMVFVLKLQQNLAILEGIEEEDRKLHVVDFDIRKGGQYMNLIHLLSGRYEINCDCSGEW